MTRATMSLAPPGGEGDDDPDRLVGIRRPGGPGEGGGAGGTGAQEVTAAEATGHDRSLRESSRGSSVTQLPRHRLRRRSRRTGCTARQWRAMSIRRAIQTCSVRLHVVEEASQRADPAGLAEQAAVHADRHHLRPVEAGRVALGVEHVEGVAQVGEEVLAGVEALRLRRSACRWCRASTGRPGAAPSCRRSCRPRSRTAGRRRSSRCRTRSRRARRPGGACSGCRGRCTSRAARRRRSAPSAPAWRCRRGASRSPRAGSGSGSSAGRGWRSRGRGA